MFNFDQVKKFLCFYSENYAIFTSFKVGFSSFRYLSSKQILSFANNFNSVNSVLQKNPNIDMYALIRDPKQRTESLYKDKCLINIDENNLQECQTCIVNIFSLDRFLNKKISFEDFVMNLDKLLETNAHFFPQHYFIPQFVKKYLYIEKLEDIKYIENNLLKCSLPIQNETKKIKLSWSNKMIDSFMSLYKKDYELYYA